MTGQMGRSVAASIREGGIQGWANGARALAERYAMLIDRAEAIYRELDELEAEDESTAQRIRKLQAAVSAQVVASDLGPKLLAALQQLGLTPMARTGPPKKGEKPNGEPIGQSPADQLAAMRQRRSGRTSS